MIIHDILIYTFLRILNLITCLTKIFLCLTYTDQYKCLDTRYMYNRNNGEYSMLPSKMLWNYFFIY